ncbi:MAG: hypothetical protein ACOX7F_03125 [Eubacteriales bacterium]|jgi:hypothetical protein
MKHNHFKSALAGAFILITMVSGYIAFGAGDSSDPLISKSYLDSVVADVLKQVDQKIANSGGSSSFGDSQVFTAVQVYKGQTILGKEGTEIILRSGNATSVCPGENGLTDTTDGLDLTGGKAIQANHVYVIPREDGRGIYMTSDGFIMVKGGYKVQ